MNQETIPYEKQIFVCTNTKVSGACCNQDGRSEAIFRQLRETAKARKLHPRIRVAQAKCLGQCAKGPNIMVYPDNVWFRDVCEADIAKVIDLYLKERE